MKITAEQEQIQVLFTTHGFIYNAGNIPSGGMRSVQWLSQNVCISRPFVFIVPIVCRSTRANMKLYRIASPDLCVNLSHKSLIDFGRTQQSYRIEEPNLASKWT